jgi:hypothetical protein
VAQKATVYYSDISLPWEAFTAAASCYETERVSENSVSYLTYGGPLANFCRVISEIEVTRRDWERIAPLGLLPILRKFRDRNASDKRDKVYALVGLVRQWGSGVLQTAIVPDYRLCNMVVFLDTTARSIVMTRSLAVLAGTLGRVHNSQYPSWITDWSCHPEINEYARLSNMVLYNASGGVTGRVRLHGSTLLEVRGRFVDRITVVGTDSDEVTLELGVSGRPALQATVASWSRLFEWSDNEEYVDGGSLGEAFWRTVCGDTLYTPPETRPSQKDDAADAADRSPFRRATAAGLRAYRGWRRQDPSNNRRTSVIGGTVQEGGAWDEDDSEAQASNAFQMAADRASGSRRFFHTRKGLIGTGPKALQHGDGVFLLANSRVPMILRPVPAKKRCQGLALRQLLAPDEETNVARFFEPGTAKPAAGAINAGAGNGAAERAQQESVRPAAGICNDEHLICYKIVGDAYVHGIMDGELMWEDRQRQVRRELEPIYIL